MNNKMYYNLFTVKMFKSKQQFIKSTNSLLSLSLIMTVKYIIVVENQIATPYEVWKSETN